MNRFSFSCCFGLMGQIFVLVFCFGLKGEVSLRSVVFHFGKNGRLLGIEQILDVVVPRT